MTISSLAVAGDNARMDSSHSRADGPRRRAFTPAEAAVGKLTAGQAEIARLKRELDRTTKRLATAEAARDIMGRAHALLESLSEGADHRARPSAGRGAEGRSVPSAAQT
ncbi:hypothetical protein ACFWQG_19560 [Rhodococcus sp. NPDC058532]|uniref:hypothetical protein n=1 Tax=Rhodococcus sp. NPDC058532 TaxID=3346540 RepID=UPI003669A647